MPNGHKVNKSKSNVEYWRKRAERAITFGEKSAEAFRADLNYNYRQCLRAVQKELNDFYMEFAEEHGMTLAEAKRRLTPKQRQSFTEMAKKHAEFAQGNIPESDLKLLEYKTKLTNATRLQELEERLHFEIDKLAVKNKEAMAKLLEDQYEDTYYKNMFSVSKGLGVAVKFNELPKKHIKTAASMKWLNKNYSDRIWDDKGKLLDKLKRELPQAFIMGFNPKVVGSRLAKELDTSYKNAVRLARTEMNHISNVATLDSYKATGVKSFQFLATLDSRTSDICADMDGEVIPLEDAESGVTVPPLHPNCRSTTIPWFEDNEITERIAKDKNGKRVTVPGSMKYAEYLAMFLGSDNSYLKRVRRGSSEEDEAIETPYEEELKQEVNEADYREISFDELKQLAIENPYNYDELKYNDEFREAFEKHSERLQDLIIVDSHEIYTGYIGTGRSFRINAYSRGDSDIEPERAKLYDITIKAVDKAIAFTKTKEKIKLRRFVDTDFVKFSFGKETEKLGSWPSRTEIVDFVQNYIGSQIPNKQYMSSTISGNEYFHNRPGILTILLDEGSDYFPTANYEEGEIILPRNTNLEIIDVRDRRDDPIETRIYNGRKHMFDGFEIVCRVVK